MEPSARWRPAALVPQAVVLAAFLSGSRGGALLAVFLTGLAGTAVLWRLSDSAAAATRRQEEAKRLYQEALDSRDQARSTLEEKVKERTADLRRAYEELKKVDAMKDSFVSSVSHELRTPLSSIRSFSELLLGYEADEATRREFLSIILQESERLTRLIDDLLDIARIEAGSIALKLEDVPPGELCERAIRAVRILAEARGQRLLLEPVDSSVRVVADRDRAVQVLVNLLSNAIKFTPAGGTIRVSLEAGRTEGPDDARKVTFAVQDEGIGIPREELRNIFEKFKQVGDALTDKPKGTGLGLPISREIVRALGGTMWVESAPGRGSSFRFTLPAAGGAGGEAVQVQPRAAALRGGAAGRRAAIADDDPGIVAVLTQTLVSNGYDVVSAGDGVEASRMVREQDVDLLILDLNMPRRSGWRVLEEIRAHPATRSLPVIVLTGMESEMDRARALALGAVELVEKGRGFTRLISEIEMVFAQRSAALGAGETGS